MHKRILPLTAAARAELERVRDRDKRAYLRECAAGLLKIADGAAPFHVALYGLHKRRHPDTVYSWLGRYLEHGVDGLVHKPRGHRGFPPLRGGGDYGHSAPGA